MTKRMYLLAALALAAALCYVTGAYDAARPETLRGFLLSMGAWGPVVFVLAFALGQLLQVPGIAFLLAAALTWSAPVAFLTAWTGAMIAGVPSFLLTRYAAHDWVQAHLPERFKRYDDYLERRGIVAVVFLRFLFALSPTFPPFAALSRIRLYQFILGSAIGVLPEVAFWTLLGPRFVEWLSARPASFWVGAGAVTAALIAGVYLYRCYRARPARPKLTGGIVPQPTEI